MPKRCRWATYWRAVRSPTLVLSARKARKATSDLSDEQEVPLVRPRSDALEKAGGSANVAVSSHNGSYLQWL